jgi:hypothetical protein
MFETSFSSDNYNVYIEDICLVQCKIRVYYQRYISRVAQPQVKDELLVFTRCNIFRSYTKLNKFPFYYNAKTPLKRHLNLILD